MGSDEDRQQQRQHLRIADTIKLLEIKVAAAVCLFVEEIVVVGFAWQWQRQRPVLSLSFSNGQYFFGNGVFIRPYLSGSVRMPVIYVDT